MVQYKVIQIKRMSKVNHMRCTDSVQQREDFFYVGIGNEVTPADIIADNGGSPFFVEELSSYGSSSETDYEP
jgi:hypothetical protein